MKNIKLILIALCLASGTFHGFSQKSYVPFVNDSKVWRHVEEAVLTADNSNLANYLVRSSYFRGDTLVNDTIYRIMYFKTEQPTPEAERVSFFIYEDVPNQKVYGYDPVYKNSVLLYDFQLKEGDRFKMYIFNHFYHTATVQKVDTITSFNNKRLKRIVFDESLVWIEGIGTVLQSYNPFSGNLICVRENNELMYLDNHYDDCDTIFDQSGWGAAETIKNYGARVYPHPVTSSSVLIANTHQNEKLQIELYSNTGALIKRDNFTSTYPIGALQLKKGIYFYRISANKQLIHSDKVVIQ